MRSTTDQLISQEWMAALDVIEDAIFMHDKDFRILRCNRAYQRLAALPFDQIIGQHYYDVFPKIDAPLSHCLHAIENPLEKEDETEIQIGDTVFRSCAYAITDRQGDYLYSVHLLEDITEHKQAEEKLRERETFIKAVLDNLPIGVAVNSVVPSVAFSYMNDNFPRIYRTTREKLNDPNGFWKVVYEDPKFRKKIKKRVQEDYESGNAERMNWADIPITRSGEETTFITARNVPMPDKRFTISMVWDVTERKQAEEALRNESLRRKKLMDSSRDGIAIFSQEHRIVEANARFAEMLGYTPEEVLDLHTWDFVVDMTETEIRATFANLAKVNATIESRHRRKNGTTYEAEVSLSGAMVGGEPMLFTISRDITDRKQMEKSLIESEEKYRGIYENAQVGIYKTRTSDGKLVMANETMGKMFGYDSADEATARYITSEHYVDPGTREKLLDFLRKHGKFDNFEARLTQNDGVVRWFLFSGVFVQNNDYIEGVVIDVTDRKIAEESLHRANRALKTLSAANVALVRAKNEDTLLKDVTGVITEIGGYTMAVVYYAEDDPQKSITPKAWSGFKGRLYWAQNLTWDDNEKGQLPIARAIRMGKTQFCHDINSECGFQQPWKKAALKHGLASNIALPLTENGKTFGALSIYSSETDAFDEEEVKLLEELADDLAYGVTALHTRVEHEQHAALLRQSLEQSIQAIAATVEARDPYTAGHQRRVSELSTAIAQEMGLPKEQVQGIHFASMIHDLGKIHIPSEILSKPGRLSDIEYMLIQTHPQAGYDILKDVRFPWPIADIILQHHERLDGSGYPQGLKGNQILLEAKIICVADVVEAMSSHRPYRSALGIEAALDELRKGRGITYDASVVDAFLKLFAEKGFSFNDESV